MEVELDYEMRLVAIDRVRGLSDRYDDIVPLEVLRRGFDFAGERISFGSFYSGIFRPRQMRGPAALSLTTTPPKGTRAAPYDDGLDEAGNTFVYHYRTAHGDTSRAVDAAEADNRSLRAAATLGVPLIYFHGIAPGQYGNVVDPTDDSRRYATREALVRLHQQRFRRIVLAAYRGRCAICALRESALLQAAQGRPPRLPRGGDRPAQTGGGAAGPGASRGAIRNVPRGRVSGASRRDRIRPTLGKPS